jgi:hypothetical protein
VLGVVRWCAWDQEEVNAAGASALIPSLSMHSEVVERVGEESLPCFWELVCYDDKVIVVLNDQSLWICLGMSDVYAQAVACIEAPYDGLWWLFRGGGFGLLGG